MIEKLIDNKNYDDDEKDYNDDNDGNSDGLQACLGEDDD